MKPIVFMGGMPGDETADLVSRFLDGFGFETKSEGTIVGRNRAEVCGRPMRVCDLEDLVNAALQQHRHGVSAAMAGVVDQTRSSSPGALRRWARQVEEAALEAGKPADLPLAPWMLGIAESELEECIRLLGRARSLHEGVSSLRQRSEDRRGR